jgi:hypothetical protein
MGVKAVAERWTRAARSMNAEDRKYALKIVDMAKRHSSEAFYALDDPLEAACLSVLVEILKEQEQLREQLEVPEQEPSQEQDQDQGSEQGSEQEQPDVDY